MKPKVPSPQIWAPAPLGFWIPFWEQMPITYTIRMATTPHALYPEKFEETSVQMEQGHVEGKQALPLRTACQSTAPSTTWGLQSDSQGQTSPLIPVTELGFRQKKQVSPVANIQDRWQSWCQQQPKRSKIWICFLWKSLWSNLTSSTLFLGCHASPVSV